MRTWILLAASLCLAACNGGHVAAPSEIVHDQVKVPVPVQCPSADVYAGIAGSRPTPLASQPMPATAQERADKTFAQLGKYEAPGGWADRAMAALTRCQTPP